MARKAKAKKQSRAARGRIGKEIFAQVEQLVGEQKMTRTAAFQRISEKTGRRAGTVAANYYRVARQRGAKLAPRRRRVGRPPGTRQGAAGRRGERTLTRVLPALRELTALLRRQESELTRLRRENDRLAEIRRLISRL
ncbi:MAG: hypothetical protein A3J75_03020 [Acidobacteria bacterium RBG_16_68_9]|nr:MAG: hypothetical protein A3J75_03020 [Acidobacteria bacterium RBG_16_68_9]